MRNAYAKEIIIVKTSGWEGLYVNGVLEGADYMTDFRDIGAYLPAYVREVYVNEVGENQLKNLVGGFPRKFTDIPSTWFEGEG